MNRQDIPESLVDAILAQSCPGGASVMAFLPMKNAFFAADSAREVIKTIVEYLCSDSGLALGHRPNEMLRTMVAILADAHNAVAAQLCEAREKVIELDKQLTAAHAELRVPKPATPNSDLLAILGDSYNDYAKLLTRFERMAEDAKQWREYITGKDEGDDSCPYGNGKCDSAPDGDNCVRCAVDMIQSVGTDPGSNKPIGIMGQYNANAGKVTIEDCKRRWNPNVSFPLHPATRNIDKAGGIEMSAIYHIRDGKMEILSVDTVERKEFTLEEICKAFAIPLHLLKSKSHKPYYTLRAVTCGWQVHKIVAGATGDILVGPVWTDYDNAYQYGESVARQNDMPFVSSD